ncbi:Uncharacterised protein [Candidatus Norongarragalina meridionalis]|nr:Uncharacterised protein [Candidatus Norongarragalina meridionalis]
MLGAREHEHLSSVRVVQYLLQQPELVVAVDEVNLLVHQFDRRGARRDRYFYWVPEYFARQVHDFGRHSRGEEKRLPVFRQRRYDALHVADETHVQHAVRLVEHEHFHAVQAREPLLHQVEEPSRSCDEHVRSPRKKAHLRILPDSAEYDCMAQARMPAVRAEAVAYLRGELASRREYEAASSPLGGAPVRSGKKLDYRHRERGGFSRPRLRNAYQILSREHERNRLRLNGSGRHVPFLLKRAENRLGKPELLESFFHIAILRRQRLYYALVARERRA